MRSSGDHQFKFRPVEAWVSSAGRANHPREQILLGRNEQSGDRRRLMLHIAQSDRGRPRRHDRIAGSEHDGRTNPWVANLFAVTEEPAGDGAQGMADAADPRRVDGRRQPGIAQHPIEEETHVAHLFANIGDVRSGNAGECRGRGQRKIWCDDDVTFLRQLRHQIGRVVWLARGTVAIHNQRPGPADRKVRDVPRIAAAIAVGVPELCVDAPFDRPCKARACPNRTRSNAIGRQNSIVVMKLGRDPGYLV